VTGSAEHIATDPPSQTAPIADWDPLSEESLFNTPQHDNDMRRTCPVAYSDRWGGFWTVFRHEDICRVARDPETFISSPTQVVPPISSPERPWLPLQSDPPMHRKYRAPLIPFFRGDRIWSFEPRMTEMANELIDGFIGQGEADFAQQLGIPLPAMGMCLLLGLPEAEWRYFHDWTDRLIKSAFAGDMDGVNATLDDVAAFAEGWIAERRKTRKEDVIDAMLHTEIDGRPMTETEIIGTFTLLFSAGHQTTADGITSSLKYLGKHPEIRAQLVADPSLLPAASVELIRLAAPIRALARTASKPVEIRGRGIGAGERVVLIFGAGSRDESVFDKPDEFDVHRDNRKHLAFGNGVHRCIGEELAKLEVRICLQEVLRRIPDYKLVGEGQQTLWPTNGYASLPVTFPVR
jgi:cytochrome P450